MSLSLNNVSRPPASRYFPLPSTPRPTARRPESGLNDDLFERLSPPLPPAQLPPPTAPTSKEVREINRQHRARLVHKGVKIAGITAAVIAGAGLIAALVSAGPAIAFALGAGAVLTGLVVGIGALAGFIRSKTHPVTPSDITRDAPNAAAARAFKEAPLVRRGVRIGGIIGGSSGAVVTVTGILGAIGLTMASSTGFTLAAGLGILLFQVAPMLGAIAVVIGLGALGGFIHSKIKAARRKNRPTDSEDLSPKTTSAPGNTSASKATGPNPIKKGAKIGASVGGGVGALGISSWAIAISIGTTVVAETVILAGLTFLPVGFGAVLAIALGIGIGALVGHLKSRKSRKSRAGVSPSPAATPSKTALLTESSPNEGSSGTPLS